MAIVAYMLDKETQIVTNGDKSLNDIISYINAKYRDPHRYVSPAEFLETANLVTGHNFTDFFNKYIWGNDWLPPIPVQDMLDYYISKAEERLATAEPAEKEKLEAMVEELKQRCSDTVELIYEEEYESAFKELENAKKLFLRIMTPWPSEAPSPTLMPTPTFTPIPSPMPKPMLTLSPLPHSYSDACIHRRRLRPLPDSYGYNHRCHSFLNDIEED